MLRAFSVSAALASLLALGNCATAAGPDQAAIPEHYVSASSSASAEAAAAKSYALAPMDSRIAPTNADFLEYATYVEQAFGAQGLTRAAPGSQPDLVVLLRYGTGAPEKRVRVNDTAEFDHVTMAAQGVEFSPAAASSGKSSAVFGPSGRSAGATFALGSEFAPKTYTTYTHFILLDGYLVDPAKDASDWEKAFETDIGSTGTSADLHQAFPYMIAATLDTIATDTGDVVRTEITGTDERVAYIRSVAGNSAP